MTQTPPHSTQDIREAVARIGRAFDGVESVNMAGRTEPLAGAVERFTRQTRLPLNLATLLSLADRINGLQAALDAQGSSWSGGGIDTGRPTIIPSVPRDPADPAGLRAQIGPVCACATRCGDVAEDADDVRAVCKGLPR